MTPSACSRAFFFIMLIWFVHAQAASAQSIETFSIMRFEDPSAIGSYVALSPPSGISPYTLIFPSSLGSSTYALRVSGSTGQISTAPFVNVVGASSQLAFFKGTDSVKGSNSLVFDESQAMLTVNGAASIAATDTVIKILNSATGTAASIGKSAVQVSMTGSMSGTGTTAIGLLVDASGAASNNAAILLNGRVGVGTSAPNTTLDIAEDVAFRELNYTTVLTGTTNDAAFSTGNKTAFVRLGGSSTASITVTGLTGGFSGKMINIFNNTGQTMIIKHENTGSAAANRIWTFSQDNLPVASRGSVSLIYSGTDSRWIVVRAIGTIGQTDAQTTKTVTNTDKLLPSSNNNYIRVTNNSGEISPTFEDGSYKGQILVIQNNGPNNLKIVNTSNLYCAGGEASLGPRDMAMFIWDGSKWYQVGFDADN